MGYILPIERNTYRNYARRMKREDEDQYGVEKADKVTFHTIEDEYDFQQKNVPYDKKKQGKQAKLKHSDSEEKEKRQPKVPGKGERFQTTV